MPEQDGRILVVKPCVQTVGLISVPRFFSASIFWSKTDSARPAWFHPWNLDFSSWIQKFKLEIKTHRKGQSVARLNRKANQDEIKMAAPLPCFILGLLTFHLEFKHSFWKSRIIKRGNQLRAWIGKLIKMKSKWPGALTSIGMAHSRYHKSPRRRVSVRDLRSFDYFPDKNQALELVLLLDRSLHGGHRRFKWRKFILNDLPK